MQQKNDKETRIVSPQFEVRATSNGKTAYGYVTIWDALSLDLGGFQERVKKGAYTEGLKARDQYVFFDHEPGNILGSVAAGTATFKEDDTGLLVTCKLPNTTLGNDVACLLERGDLSKMSVGFYCDDEEWTKDNGTVIRTITQATVFEASFVSRPAFPDTSAAIRSMSEHLKHAAQRATHQTVSNDNNAKLIELLTKRMLS